MQIPVIKCRRVDGFNFRFSRLFSFACLLRASALRFSILEFVSLIALHPFSQRYQNRTISAPHSEHYVLILGFSLYHDFCQIATAFRSLKILSEK